MIVKRFACVCIAAMLCAVMPSFVRASGQIDWEAMHQNTRMALFKAQQSMNEGSFLKAIDDLKKFQERKPKYNHFLVEFNIGTAYGFLGDFENAIVYLERATKMNDAYAPLWLNLGRMYYQTKNFERSGYCMEKGFRCSVQKEPDNLFMAMAAYYQANDLAQAIKLGEELVSTYGRQTMQVVSLLANAYMMSENYSGAIDMLNRLLGVHPDNPKIWKLVTQAYFKNQQYVKAAIAYETYGYLHTMTRDELIIMGDLFTMVGIPMRAAQYYERALKDGGSPEEFEKMSVAYYSAYEFDSAISAIDRAVSKKTTSERLLLKAQLYYLQDKFEEAQKLYVAAAELLSRDGHEWLMAGYCAMRQGETAIAKELLHKATEFPSQRQEALAMLKMLTPVEEIKNLMASVQEDTVTH